MLSCVTTHRWSLFFIVQPSKLSALCVNLVDVAAEQESLLRQIVRQGTQRGEFREGLTQDEIVRAFAMWERAQLYDWCLCSGDYSLVTYADKMTPLFLESYRRIE